MVRPMIKILILYYHTFVIEPLIISSDRIFNAYENRRVFICIRFILTFYPVSN